jgi:hypothetical protein
VKKIGNNATYYARGIENVTLSINMAKPVFANRENSSAIPELLEYNELEIIYANIRV